MAREQFAREEVAPTLVDTRQNLIGAQQQQTALLECRLFLGPHRREVLALAGQGRIFRRRVGRGRLAQFLEAIDGAGKFRCQSLGAGT